MSAIGRKQTLVRAARYPGIRMMANGALAERVGFEPTVRLPVRRISSAVLSTTQPPLREVSPGRRELPALVGGGALAAPQLVA
jgi:hypothetical protein